MTLHLSRAVLDRNAGSAALAPLLDPPDPDQAFDAHRRLVWTLFPGRQASRDFLWRADGRGRFLVLSHRPPVQSDLFRPLETTEFTPVLTVGDRLAFVLRVNATKDRRLPEQPDGRRPSRRVDLVMDALYGESGQAVAGRDRADNRPAKRMEIADRVAADWLGGQGNRHGFALDRVRAEDYSVRRIPRGRHSPATLGVLDLSGLLTVTEPAAFVAALGAGFGRARAFGCGLMLIRRG